MVVTLVILFFSVINNIQTQEKIFIGSSLGIMQPYSRLVSNKQLPTPPHFEIIQPSWVSFYLYMEYHINNISSININIRNASYGNGVQYSFIDIRYPDGKIKESGAHRLVTVVNYMQYGLELSFKSNQVHNKYRFKLKTGIFYMPVLDYNNIPAFYQHESLLTKLYATDSSDEISSYNVLLSFNLGLEKLIQKTNYFTLDVTLCKGFIDFRERKVQFTLTNETIKNQTYNVSIFQKGDFLAVYLGYKLPLVNLLKPVYKIIKPKKEIVSIL